MIQNRLLFVLPVPTDLLCMCSLAVDVGFGLGQQFVGKAAAHLEEDNDKGEGDERRGFEGRKRPARKLKFLRTLRPPAEGGEAFLYMEGQSNGGIGKGEHRIKVVALPAIFGSFGVFGS